MPSDVAEYGIDTWRIARYLPDDADVDRARLVCPEGRLADRVEGHVVGFIPGLRMIWAEGHPVDGSLAHPTALQASYDRLLEALEVAQVPTGTDAGIARLDGTVTTTSPEGAHGLATLCGIAALDIPRIKPVVYGKPPQTVALQGERSRKLYGRVYDKGYESGAAAPGEVLRFEDQRRFTKDTRRAVSQVEPQADFERRFSALARSAEGVRVVTLPVLAREMAERVNSGEVAIREAERLVGHLALNDAGATRYPRRTLKRRRAELRDRGLVLADAFYEPITVDLGQTFESVVAAWSA